MAMMSASVSVSVRVHAAPIARRLHAAAAGQQSRAALVGTPQSTKSRTTTTVRAVASSASPSAASSASSSGGDKVVVITGANTGLGFISAVEISKKKGYKVVMACRDKGRGEKAAAEVLSLTGVAPDLLLMDLSSLGTVDAFVSEFTSKYDRLDVLMNNAGVMALPERKLTKEGFEMQMGVNHLAHFYLTDKLMPTMLNNTPGRPRVVNLSSVAHEFGHPDFDNINSEGMFGYLGAGWLTYGRTKLANMYFTYELHRRLRSMGGRGNDIDVNCVHPGIVDTELPRSLSINFYPIMKQIGGLITPAQGAAGQIEVATGAKYEGISGKYIAEQSGPNNPGGQKGTFAVSESSRESYDADAAARLWRKSKEMTGADWSCIGESKQNKM